MRVSTAEPYEAPRSLTRTLRAFRHGYHDRTTQLVDGRFMRATHTPDGPGTLVLRWHDDHDVLARVDAAGFGPGASWLVERLDRLVGDGDRPVRFADAPAPLDRALRAQRTARFGASGTLYHEVLPVILAQRITAGEAIKQWYRLVDTFGASAPGPADLVGDLRLPPPPDDLARLPLWRFHPLGIEESRARPLVELARHPVKLFEWADLTPGAAAELMQHIPRIGPWTAWSAIGPAMGDPDAVPVGDFHFPNTVAWFLAGEARADDYRMLELLAPYAGQRRRVLRAIVSSGRAPSFGPRRRIMPIARM